MNNEALLLRYFMKAISVVGFKNSGKTAVCETLLSIWEKRGFIADYLKFSHHVFDLERTDTQRMLHKERVVFGVNDEQSLRIDSKKHSLLDILGQCQNSFLLVEGGKNELFLPRVVCLRSKEEFDELNKGLAIATFGFDDFTNTGILPHFTMENIEQLAHLVLEEAFVLAGLNCEACKRPSCHELACEIVAKRASVEECSVRSENKSVSIQVGGKALALNPFVEDMIKETVKGMLSTLKGNTIGDMQITIKE